MRSKLTLIIKSANRADRFYYSGLIVALISIAGVVGSGRNYYIHDNILSAAIFLLSLGFLIELIGWLRRAWRSSYLRTLVVILHAMILVVSGIPARHLVAESLGLPPQDFDVTVGITAIAIYPIIWLMAFCFIAFVIQVLLLLLLLVTSIGRMLVDLNKNILGVKRTEFDEFLEWFIKPGLYSFGRIFGMAFVAFLSLGLAEFYHRSLSSYQNTVRLVAYHSDYHQLLSYPGVDRVKRARIHENGVVSYAELANFDAVITVSNISLE